MPEKPETPDTLPPEARVLIVARSSLLAFAIEQMIADLGLGPSTIVPGLIAARRVVAGLPHAIAVIDGADDPVRRGEAAAFAAAHALALVMIGSDAAAREGLGCPVLIAPFLPRDLAVALAAAVDDGA